MFKISKEVYEVKNNKELVEKFYILSMEADLMSLMFEDMGERSFIDKLEFEAYMRRFSEMRVMIQELEIIAFLNINKGKVLPSEQ